MEDKDNNKKEKEETQNNIEEQAKEINNKSEKIKINSDYSDEDIKIEKNEKSQIYSDTKEKKKKKKNKSPELFETEEKGKMFESYIARVFTKELGCQKFTKGLDFSLMEEILKIKEIADETLDSNESEKLINNLVILNFFVIFPN